MLKVGDTTDEGPVEEVIREATIADMTEEEEEGTICVVGGRRGIATREKGSDEYIFYVDEEDY